MNGQGLLRLILKGEVVPIAGASAAVRIGGCAPSAGAAGEGVGSIFHGDDLGRGVQHVAIRHTGFHHDHGTARDQAGDGGGAVLPGGAGRQHIPIAVLHRARGIGHGLPGDGIQLGNGQGA